MLLIFSTIPGPPDLPFEDPDVRVYVDNLFVEGLLQPVKRPDSEEASPSWCSFGIRRDSRTDSAERLASLLRILETDLPATDARHEQWLTFAQAWAELVVLTVQSRKKPADHDGIEKMRVRVDLAFRGWIERRFGPLHNLPATPPVLVHHVARFLANQRTSRNSRTALVVVDGLAFDQWLVLRDQVSRQDSHLRFEEGAIFAWVPTITSISRQTIFAGQGTSLLSVEYLHNGQGGKFMDAILGGARPGFVGSGILERPWRTQFAAGFDGIGLRDQDDGFGHCRGQG